MPRLRRSTSPGFTLIELMVVIMLIGILSAMLLPEMRGTYENALLRSTCRELVNVCQLAYSRSVSLNQLHRLQLDARTGRYFIESHAEPSQDDLRRAMPSYVRVKDVPGSEGKLDSRITIEIHRPAEDSAPNPNPEQERPAFADPGAPLPEGDGISFYPDGTADAREIRLRDREGFRLAVRINPITARVQIVELTRQ